MNKKSRTPRVSSGENKVEATAALVATLSEQGKRLGRKRDVAAFAQVNLRSVDNFMSRGCPYIKLSKRMVRFDLDEVAAWLEANFRTRRMGPEGGAK